MAGLLDDGTMAPQPRGLLGDTIDDPRTLALFAGLRGLLGGRGTLQGIANGVGAYGDAMQQSKQAAAQEQMRRLQMQQQQMALAQAQRAMQRQNALEALPEQFMGRAVKPDTMDNRDVGQPGEQRMQQGPFDMAGYAQAMFKYDPKEALALQQYLRKDKTPIKLAAGESLIDQDTYKPIVTNPKDDAPSALKEYQFAKSQGYGGSFLDFQLAQKKAGAANTMVKVENKTGESLAGQVGPMAKDSRIQTQGAVKMFDAANRLETALDSNQVSAGPLASRGLKVKQFITSITGGDDTGIRQTRQAIKSLAQMSVEARKQLQGQGQVTEAEAAAVAKADAGDIDDLTTGELRDLVTLTKRAAHFQAKAHADLLGTLGGKDETKSLVPFYSVQGLEPLMKYEPALPQIGNGGVRRYNPATGKLE